MRRLPQAVRRLREAGAWLLNQAVLLRGVNDDLDTLMALSESLIDLQIVPYYLHQLDRVAGAAHFEVPVGRGRAVGGQLRGGAAGLCGAALRSRPAGSRQ